MFPHFRVLHLFTHRFRAGLLTLLLGFSATLIAQPADFINSWLLLGPFDNRKDNAGFQRDWIGEAAIRPAAGQKVAGQTWCEFDDRYFSRNYDDYQDLYSYYHLKRNRPVDGVAVYAGTYVHSPATVRAQLRLGADTEVRAWCNGREITLRGSGGAKDSLIGDIDLAAGWNFLLLKVANQEKGRFGFYVRICDGNGNEIPDLTWSSGGDTKALGVVTGGMNTRISSASLPVAWREWSYIGAHPKVEDNRGTILCDFLPNPKRLLSASDFRLQAQGGTPPYSWGLRGGALPPGLSVTPDGRIVGTVDRRAKIGNYEFTVRVRDSKDAVASKKLSMEVRERPNKWFEEDRLVALLHNPDRVSKGELPRLVKLIKDQGYQLIMPISYNNGEHPVRFRWPCSFSPDRATQEDFIGAYKRELEKQDIDFGMYMGNLNTADAPYPVKYQHLMVEEALCRYRPKALWFDWGGMDCEAGDSLYSMIRSFNPEIVVVLNGHVRGGQNGDWDEICFEGWGCWGNLFNMWARWPVETPWPKKNAPESWRLLVHPGSGVPGGDCESDWQEYLRVQLSLIGEGFVADIDHSFDITSDGGNLSLAGKQLQSLDDSPLIGYHRKMAEWASPAGIPPLYPAYTKVNPGPLQNGSWGYNTVNLKRDAVYLHLMRNPRGKTGMPDDPSITVGSLNGKVKRAVWMNANRPLSFSQRMTSTDRTVTIDLSGVKADPIDTILKLELAEPLPEETMPEPPAPVPAGNLVYRKPAELRSLDGTRILFPAGQAKAEYGVDGDPESSACACFEYSWSFQTDLGRIYSIDRVKVAFPASNFPTVYEVQVSDDGRDWRTAVRVDDNRSGGVRELKWAPLEVRYIRIAGIKPDGPNQTGVQMAVSELEVYSNEEEK